VGPACQPMFHSLLPARNHSRCCTPAMLPARLGPWLAAARPPRVAWPAGGRCPARLGQLRRQRYTANFFSETAAHLRNFGMGCLERIFSRDGLVPIILESNIQTRWHSPFMPHSNSNQTLSSAQCIICVKLKQWSDLLHTYRACWWEHKSWWWLIVVNVSILLLRRRCTYTA
jgi:hypothetical protein